MGATNNRVRTRSGMLDTGTGVLYIGNKPFGIRTYEGLIEDLENTGLNIQTVDMTEVSIGQRAKELLMDVYELGIDLRLTLAHEQELVSMMNSGTKQIDEMGSAYVDWLIDRSLELNNPLMVLEERGKTAGIVQYLDDKGDTIRFKKIRSYATQPYICYQELKLNRDIYNIITVNKTDIINKRTIWRFVGTGLEHAIVETLELVITKQLEFRP